MRLLLQADVMAEANNDAIDTAATGSDVETEPALKRRKKSRAPGDEVCPAWCHN